MMNIETKEVLFKKKFLALNMYTHSALGVVELGIDGEKVREGVRELHRSAQACLNECREAIDG